MSTEFTGLLQLDARAGVGRMPVRVDPRGLVEAAVEFELQYSYDLVRRRVGAIEPLVDDDAPPVLR